PPPPKSIPACPGDRRALGRAARTDDTLGHPSGDPSARRARRPPWPPPASAPTLLRALLARGRRRRERPDAHAWVAQPSDGGPLCFFNRRRARPRGGGADGTWRSRMTQSQRIRLRAILGPYLHDEEGG